MKKNNSFSKKTITSILISSISLFIIVGYYFFAFADDDAFSNKLSIRNSVITSVIDGEEPFDSDNSAGNDSSNQNNIVRTFDKVIYSISYELYQKSVSNSEPQNQTNDENNQVGDVTPDSRSIIVDVILPSNIDGTVYSNGQPYSLISVFNNYKYAEFEIEGSIGQNSFDFSLANIYGSNGETFSPVIVLRESTDEESKSISGLTEEQRSQSLDTILSLLGSNPSCDYGNGCNISISGKEKYTIKLFKGTHEVNGKDTDMAIGFMIGLEDSNEKHIKGVLYPTSVNFDINISNNIANDILYNGENDKYMIKPYNQNNSDYDIYLDDNHTNEMPDTYDGSTYNGNVSATYNNNNLSISVSNINFNDQMTVIGNISYYYLSTNSFIIKSSRKSFSENTEDITIDFKAMQSENIIDTIQDVDKLGKFVGPYESRISIYPEYDKEHKKDDGLAILNFGEYFYFKEDIQYSVNNVGSSLKNLNNFIKIDNDAIKLVLYDNQVENQIIPQENAVNNTTSKVGYYYGKWTTEFIKMKDNAPSSCPNLELLGKEELMNLYGGPCIEFKENVSYSEFFDDSKEYGPMAMNILFTPSTDNGILVNSAWTVWHKAKIIDDTNLERSVRQISNSSTALFNNNDNVDELYYLSSNIDKNDIESMMNPNNYTKTNYDFVNRTIINNHSTICNDSLNCAITGNSILVSAIRVDKPSIETYRTNMTSRQTTEFYYYPIEWRIKGSAHKDTLISSVRFNNAYVKVSFPKYLQKIEYGAIDNSIGITNEENLTEIIDGEEYNTYIYTIDMKNRGNVDIDLPIYTNIYLNTPNNYQPKVYAEIDYDVVNGNSISNSVSPISSRRTLNQEVTLHNQVDVNTQGTTTPTYIEKNGTFTYKMEAYNNSVSDYIYKNSSLIYVLPYKGDSSYSDLSSKFVSNGYKVKIPNLPSGYKAYYTNGPSNTIISEEIMINSTKTHEWIEWENPSIEKDNITAIKIEKNSDFVREEFFGGSDGITAQVTPIGSGVGDVYYNAFYLIADRPSNYVCVPQDENDPSCDNVRDTKIFYSSNRSSTSVYNREISGFVWEDYDYSGLYEENEKKLENIPISICKVSEESKQEENYNEIDPNTYVKTTDECIKETITDVTGSFIVNGLVEGDYYVKYTFDNQKYTVTDFQKTSEGHSASINSKSFQLPGTNIAVSHVISFNNKDRVMKKEYINLGLKIKKQFAVDINKYITKTELTVDGVTTTENYKNASKVSLNVKNTKDAHVRVTYSFVIENVKYFPGYVGLITDVMPNGMTFNPNIKENKDWIQMGNVLYYNGLSKVLLLPNEKNYFNLVLDLDIKKGGYYINFVSTDDLILMGDEVPNYDFIIDNSQNSGNNETENNGEGNIGD